jgi:IS4 transposase
MHESVTQYEEQHNITTRLTIGTPEYAAAKKNVAVFRYRKAVAELERLVVQRLLELTKLNVSGVGEFQDGHEKIKV